MYSSEENNFEFTSLARSDFFNSYNDFCREPEDFVSTNLNERNFNYEIKKPINPEFRNLSDEQTGFTFSKKLNAKIDLEISKPNNFKIISGQKAQLKNNICQKNDKIIEVRKNTSDEQKVLGRKKKDSIEKGEHTKYSDDNMSRKVKHFIILHLLSFINSLLANLYGNNIGCIKKKKLLKLKQKQVINSKADFNKKFLYFTIKDIFSDTISTKLSKYSPEHNKKLIEELLNEKDEQKRILFEKIFNLSFLDCLKHFRGDIYIKELDGMTGLDEACKLFEEMEDYPDYVLQFKYYIQNYENNIMKKKGRNRKSKKTIETDN